MSSLSVLVDVVLLSSPFPITGIGAGAVYATHEGYLVFLPRQLAKSVFFACSWFNLSGKLGVYF